MARAERGKRSGAAAQGDTSAVPQLASHQPYPTAKPPTHPPTFHQVLELLDSGERHRHFGETKMNKNSSRSHTIFRMVVESRSRDANPDDAQVRYCSKLLCISV